MTVRSRNISAAIGLLLLTVTVVAAGCARKNPAPTQVATVAPKPLPDTLRVGTLYSPTSYFIYRETPMGYDYDRIRRFTDDKKIALQLEVIPNLQRAVEMLDSGMIDVLAYEVPVTSEYREHVVPCGPESITYQVLVQPKTSREERITDVTQLVGRDVYVERDSKYHQRIINLDNELGGGIKIHPISRDTLITDDLIEMVSDGKIPLTIVDSDIARINKTYYSDLDITLKVSFEQRSAWGVAPGNEWLADSIDTWSEAAPARQQQAELLKQYFEKSKSEMSTVTVDFSSGKISPFDNLFRKAAKTIGWDWRLLAAQGYTESRFDSTVVSWAGARGVMQLMPVTARAHGLTDARITCNADNIMTAAKIIAELNKTFASKVKDKEERKKFIIAAFNSGAAHILDAIALAEKYGYNPQRWDGNVEVALSLKSKPEYYNDPVCRFGYFKSAQTNRYVEEVYAFYSKAKARIKQ